MRFFQAEAATISLNSRENKCARVPFLTNLQTLGLQLYLKIGSGTAAFL